MEEPSKGQGQRRWKELRGRETLVNVKLKLGARGPDRPLGICALGAGTFLGSKKRAK